MVISKQMEGSVVQSLYDSSNVIASQFNTDTKNLVIIFSKGNQYLYENVEYSDYTKFEVSSSQGKSFNEFIKKYSGKKLGEVDVTSIKEDIRLIKESNGK